VVSVAYIDPGNWGSNIAAGSHFGFSLLLVVWLSGFLAVYFQYLAGLVGLSGAGLLDLFEARLKRFKPLLAPPLVAMILATDMAEYIGFLPHAERRMCVVHVARSWRRFIFCRGVKGR
jgi:manganese transport protein